MDSNLLNKLGEPVKLLLKGVIMDLLDSLDQSLITVSELLAIFLPKS